MLAKHTEHNAYSSFLYNYAIGVASCDGYQIVMDEFGDLSSIVQYQLLGNLRRHWFEKNGKEACNTIQHLLKYKSVWSKKLAIDYWEMSIQHDISLFREYFTQMKHLRIESKELWRQMIPAFVYYINNAGEIEIVLPEYYEAVDCLRTLPADTIESKICFLGCIQYCKELADCILEIYRELIAVSFDQNRQKSFVSRFFRTQALKYGVRSGHIVRGSKKEKFYQATPFQRFEKKMEIAASYVNDPVDYEMRRRSYLSEVIPDETDN